MKRVALFGGSFDPVHIGHLIVARAVAEAAGLARVVFVPSAQPPHKGGHDLADQVDRLEMVRLAIAGEPVFDVSDCELNRPGPSYTFDTVSAYRESLEPGTPICWIIGADSLADLVYWHRVEELVEACDILTAARPGWEHPDLTALSRRLTAEQIERLRAGILDTPRIDVSASQIRERLRTGRSIRYLVPPAVLDHIGSRNLYRL